MRLLVISHTFPPSGHSNAKRPYYLVRAFLDAGWQRYEAGTLQCDAEKTGFWSSDVQVPRYVDLVSRDAARNQE